MEKGKHQTKYGDINDENFIDWKVTENIVANLGNIFIDSLLEPVLIQN